MENQTYTGNHILVICEEVIENIVLYHSQFRSKMCLADFLLRKQNGVWCRCHCIVAVEER